MLRSSRKLSSVVFANQIVRIGSLILVFALLCAGGAGAQTVVTYSFDVIQWCDHTGGDKCCGVFWIVQFADHDEFERRGWAVNCAKWRAAGGSNVHDHGIRNPHERRIGNERKLHDQAQ
jgi:hypothetical protein